MVEEIYGDVLFIINFSMDFLSLYLVGKLLHMAMKPWRVILGASIGAVYGVLELIFTVSRPVSLLLTTAVMIVMCFLSFGRQRMHRFLMTVVLFCGVNMLIGGMMTAAFVGLGAYEQYIEIGGDLHTIYGDMPIWLFVILSAISALATFVIGRVFRSERGHRTCEVLLRFEGREETLLGLVDSGNLAEEPLSGMPVIFLKEEYAAFLPPALLAAMRSGVSSLDYHAASRLRFVPSKTVSGEGVLLAAVPERLAIRIGRTFEERRALVAVDFTDGDYGGFGALVPEILM